MACPSATCIAIGQPVPFRCNRYASDRTNRTKQDGRGCVPPQLGVYTRYVSLVPVVRPVRPDRPAGLTVVSTQFAPSTTCVCFHLRRAARAVTQTYERALAPSGLVPGQFSVLTVLHRFGPQPLSVLADLMGMDRTTLTRNLRPMERDGLVRVKAGEKQDQRIRRVGLTAAGERKWQEAEPLWAQVHRHMVQGLGTDGWPALRDQLNSAIAAAGQSAGTLLILTCSSRRLSCHPQHRGTRRRSS